MAASLSDAGHEATHVIDAGLRGKSDAEILEHCRSTNAILVSADLGFSSLLSFPLGSHPGIVIVRLPNELRTANANQLVVSGIADSQEELNGGLMIVEPGKVRLRKGP